MLKKVDPLGGIAVTICELPGRAHGYTWTSDDVIVFGALNSGLLQVSGAGGEPRPYLDLPDGERGHSHPELLPGGGGVLFGVAGRAAVGGVDAYSGLSGAQIAVHEHETGERRVLVEGSSPRFLPTGHLTFARSGALWAVPFDSDRLELNGEPVPVLDDLLVSSAGGAVTALANDGSLVYAPASQAETSLFWVDRNGREEPLGLPSGNYSLASISPAVTI